MSNYIQPDENDHSHKKIMSSPIRKSLITLEPLEQRHLSIDNIRERAPDNVEDFSFPKLRGRVLEMERKVIDNVTRVPTKSMTVCPGGKQSIVDSLKQQEDFSFHALRAKALKLETLSNKDKEDKIDESSAKKTIAIGSNRKASSEDKKRSEPSSPPPSKFSLNSSGKESYTPNRLNKYYKQRINKEEVEATDMSHASVKKLSQWLAEKPFEKHKKPVVTRKGAHIVMRARVFEKDYTATVMEEMSNKYFPVGKVSEGKQWLEMAFKNAEESDQSKSGDLEQFSVFDKAKIFENAFKAKRRSTVNVDTRTLYGDS